MYLTRNTYQVTEIRDASKDFETHCFVITVYPCGDHIGSYTVRADSYAAIWEYLYAECEHERDAIVLDIDVDYLDRYMDGHLAGLNPAIPKGAILA